MPVREGKGREGKNTDDDNIRRRLGEETGRREWPVERRETSRREIVDNLCTNDRSIAMNLMRR